MLNNNNPNTLRDTELLFNILFGAVVPLTIEHKIFQALSLIIAQAMKIPALSDQTRAANRDEIIKIVAEYDIARMLQDVRNGKGPKVNKATFDYLAGQHSSLVKWAIGFFYTISSVETKNLIAQLTALDNSEQSDVTRGKAVAAFMLSPTIRNSGLGFCRELWQNAQRLDLDYFMEYQKQENAAAATPTLSLAN